MNRRVYHKYPMYLNEHNRRRFDRREYKTPFMRFIHMPFKVFVRRTIEELQRLSYGS